MMWPMSLSNRSNSATYRGGRVSHALKVGIYLMSYQLIGLSVWMIVTNSANWENQSVLLIDVSCCTVTCRIRGSAGSNNLDIRVGLGQSIVEHREPVSPVGVPTARETSQPVLIADLDELKLKRLWMTQLCATSTPFGIDWAADEFDLVKSVVDVVLEFLLRRHVSVERKSCPNTENCRMC